MVPTEIKKSTIAVGNIITGVYNFLVIGIPLNWRITGISMNSDVFYSFDQGNIKWVAEGEIEHLLQTKTATASLRIKIKRGIKDKNKFKCLKNITPTENTLFFTHKAEIYNYIEKFLWKKRPVLGVFFQCTEKDRTILIEFINVNPWVSAIIECLREGQCHLSEKFEKALDALDMKDERFDDYT